MKTRNTIYALLTVLMSMVGVSTFAHDIEVANSDGVTIYYTWQNNQTELAVSYQGSSYRYNYNRYTGTVVIPSTVTYNGNSYPVTIIDNQAFADCSGLTSVTIPNSVTTIGMSAFEDCRGLTEVTIPNSVTWIMDSAFLGTAWYNNQPDGIVYAGNIAYKYKGTMPSNTSIILREGTVGIGDGAFEDCSDLTSVTIPNSVTSIPQYAFCGCSGLTEVTIPNSVTSIGFAAFDGTAWYESQPDGIVYARNIAYKYKGTMPSNTSIILREGTVGIGDQAFYGCSGLTSVTIPNSVTSIGGSAFYGCSSLTEINIPNSVTNIGNGVFRSCNSLTSISVESGNTNYDSRDNCNAIIKTTSNTLIAGCKNTVIPTSVTSIEANAFHNCSGLTSLTIPNSVTYIGISAFRWCDGLTSVTIPNSVAYIGEEAFSGCTGLTEVTIPNSVAYIGSYAFSSCYGLTSVTFPNSVTYIGMSPFNNCNRLTAVKVDKEIPLSINSDTFSNRANATLYVPAGSKAAYQSANYWKNFKEIVEYGDITFADANVKAICVQNWDTDGDGELSTDEAAAVTDLGTVFKSNTTITSFDELQYFTGLTNIGNTAFYGCSNLNSVTIPESVTSIGVNVLKNSGWYNKQRNGLLYLDNWLIGYKGTLPEGETIIENGTKGIAQSAFFQYSGTLSVTIPEGVTSIPAKAFQLCKGLVSVTIPESVTSIGSYAFDHCTGLTSITIPNSVTSIGSKAFEYCSSLTSLTIPKSVVNIADDAFVGDCSGLSSIVVDSNNTVYDSRDNCNAIIHTSTNILIKGCNNTIIPNNVTGIGYCAFFNCSALASVTIPNSVTSIGEEAFSGCSSLTSVTIGNSVTSIGDHAFNRCSSLTSVTIPSSVTSIGEYAFYNCNRLTAVKVGMESPLSISSFTFSNRTNATLYVPKGSKAAYQSANYWIKFKEIVEFPDADVNQDGEIDVVDVVDIARFVVGAPGDTFVEFLADLNSDDEVNVADAVVLVNEIAGDQNFAKAYGAPRQDMGDDRLTLTENDDHSVSFSMESQRPYTAFQFDLYINSEDDVMAMALNAARKNGHQLLYNKMDEGHYRVVALSVANNGFNGNGGELLNIQLDGVNTDDVTIGSIHFITSDGTDHRFDDLTVLGEATSIQPIHNSQFIIHNSDVYDLSGRKVSESSVLPKGVYVVNGKKVIVK